MNKQTGIVLAIIVLAVIVGALLIKKSPTVTTDNSGNHPAVTSTPSGEETAATIDASLKTPQAAGTGATTGGTPAKSGSTGATAGGTPVAPAIKTFTVTGSNYAFDPKTITVNKGDTVKIIFKNSGGMHDFKIDEFNVATERLESGDQTTVQFVADKSGTFQYYCSVGSHRAMGMWGTLTVI